MIRIPRLPSIRCLLVLSAMLGVLTSQAQVLGTLDKVQVTQEDLLLGAPRQNGAARNPSYNNPAVVRQTTSVMLFRRSLAAAAVAEGLDKDPAVQAALVQARDRVLSDAKLAKVDEAHRPTLAQIESYARSVYLANPEKFQSPEQIRARHLLIGKNTPDAKAKAEELLKQLQGGADFATLAKEKSEDTGSGARGGDLGVFARGRMVPQFEEAAFALQKQGELSGLVETQFGYHIIQLTERRPAGKRSFDEVKEGLMRETETALINDARIKEQERVLQNAQFDDAAIEAFSRAQR
jgi:peptidyl-prolyl cis-trans isomerase C